MAAEVRAREKDELTLYGCRGGPVWLLIVDYSPRGIDRQSSTASRKAQGTLQFFQTFVGTAIEGRALAGRGCRHAGGLPYSMAVIYF
jgi:hypothetical protein